VIIMRLGWWLIGLLLPFMVSAGEGLTELKDRPLAADFQLVDREGKVWRLSDLRGKPLLINFWATWCPPCRREMPSMERAWQQLQQEGIWLLAVNVGEDPATVREFVTRYPVSFPILFDRNSRVSEAWQVPGLPVTWLVDSEGRLVYRAIGHREWDDPALLAALRGLAAPAQLSGGGDVKDATPSL
jgi:peroxiredoxin